MRAALAAVLAAALVGASGLLIAPSAQAAPSRATAAGQHVMIQNYAYSPASLSVDVGVTVTWTNHDEAKHDVVGSGPASFRSPLLSKGQSWSYTFQVAGAYAYYCSLHPDMRARVTATAAAQPAPQPQPQQPAQQQPQAQQPAQQPQAPASTAPSSTAKSRSSAAPPASSAPPVVMQQPVQQAAPQTTQSIDPMLLIAGIVTGVAVLCLLLLGSRRPD